MSSSVAKGNGGKKKKGGYKMAPKLPTGDVLVDSSKNEWIIKSSIGRGGFGEIYTASSRNDKSGDNYVIKIEPSENGPLFCEKTVYIRIAKKEDISEYMKSKGLKSLGMPRFFGSGTHIVNGTKLRFLVMERYKTDLWSIFMAKNRIFPPATVFKVGLQVLDVLEYIHSKGYVHADIKGANLLLGLKKGTENQVYLVDFGLAARYVDQYKPDPRRAHNGTLEYTSRDGHEGIVTRRGDIEGLGYNLLQWLASVLPWEGIKNVQEIQVQKNKYMKNAKTLMQACFKNKNVPRAIEKYFGYLTNMQPLDEPDYKTLKQILKEGIASTADVSNKLEFSFRSNSKTTQEKTNTKTKSKAQISPVPQKIHKGNDGVRRRGRSGSSKPFANETVDIFDSSSDEDYIESTPEEKTKVKKSWKDCPSVVSCAELLFKDDKSLRRSKRNK